MHSAKLVGTATTVSTLICAVLRRKGSRGLQIRDAWGSLRAGRASLLQIKGRLTQTMSLRVNKVQTCVMSYKLLL